MPTSHQNQSACLPIFFQEFVDKDILSATIAHYLVGLDLRSWEAVAELPATVDALATTFPAADESHPLRSIGSRFSLVAAIKLCRQRASQLAAFPSSSPPIATSVPPATSSGSPLLSSAQLDSAQSLLANPSSALDGKRSSFPNLLNLGDKQLSVVLKDKELLIRPTFARLINAGFQHGLYLLRSGRVDE
ncbi:MAG: hypothetical protein GY854_18015, partial [Deltaproteobacteria bacterium]|nr:hypothetical protein [Deltaproteobacteria bacterium]